MSETQNILRFGFKLRNAKYFVFRRHSPFVDLSVQNAKYFRFERLCATRLGRPSTGGRLKMDKLDQGETVKISVFGQTSLMDDS